MQELSRLKLFKWTIDLLTGYGNEHEEILWIRQLAEHIVVKNNNTSLNDSDMNEVIRILNYNIKILENIESSFVYGSEENRVTSINRVDERREIILEEYKKGSDLEEKEIKFNKNNRYKYVFDNKKRPEERFNHLLAFLNDISKKCLENTNVLDIENLSKRFNDFNKIFVSYAYDDKLYTFCLFLYLLTKGILAYVDWIFCTKLSDGSMIKNNLSERLSNANQLLFIRTSSSELHVRRSDSYDIKGWCAWEIGEYYHVIHYYDDYESIYDKKLFLELYGGRDDKDDKILDDLLPLRKIENKILCS